MGDEPLFTVQNIRTVSLLFCSGVKVSTSTTSLFGDSKVAVNGLVLELVHELSLELWLAIVLKDTPVHVSCMMKMHTHSARSTRELFLNLQDFKLVEIPSTVFRWQIVTIEVVLLGEFIELLWEGIGYLDLFLHFFEWALCQFADLLEVCLKLLIRDLCVRIH